MRCNNIQYWDVILSNNAMQQYSIMGSQITRAITRNQRHHLSSQHHPSRNRRHPQHKQKQAELKELCQLLAIMLSTLTVFSIGFLSPHQPHPSPPSILLLAMLSLYLGNLPVLIMGVATIIWGGSSSAWGQIGIVYVLTVYVYNYCYHMHLLFPTGLAAMYQGVLALGAYCGRHVLADTHRHANMQADIQDVARQSGTLVVVFSCLIIMCLTLIVVGDKYSRNYTMTAGLSLGQQWYVLRSNLIDPHRQYTSLRRYGKLGIVALHCLLIATIPAPGTSLCGVGVQICVPLLLMAIQHYCPSYDPMPVLLGTATLWCCATWGQMLMQDQTYWACEVLVRAVSGASLVGRFVPKSRVGYYVAVSMAAMQVQVQVGVIGCIGWMCIGVGWMLWRNRHVNNRDGDYRDGDKIDGDKIDVNNRDGDNRDGDKIEGEQEVNQLLH